jgi:tetratricopeptide (TPR) repeat protein
MGLFDFIKPKKLTKKEYLERGNTWLEKKNNKKAVLDYTKAILLDFNYIEAYFLRGLARVREEGGGISSASILYLDALKDFSKVIEIKPSSVSYYNRANIYDNLKCDGREAIEDYKKALELSSNNEDFHLICSLKIGIAISNWLVSFEEKEKTADIKRLIEENSKEGINYLNIPSASVNEFSNQQKNYEDKKLQLLNAVNELQEIKFTKVSYYIFYSKAIFYRATLKKNIGDEKGYIKDLNLSASRGFQLAQGRVWLEKQNL